MQKLIFLLGTTPELSMAELRAVLPAGSSLFLLGDQICEVSVAEEYAPAAIMEKLGGTVKILSIIHDDLSENTQVTLTVTQLENLVVAYFADRDRRVKLALAELGRDHLPKIEIEKIKDRLEDKGVPVRYFTDSRKGLSAAVLLHKKGIEEIYFIQLPEGRLIMAQTVAIQDIDTWTDRDRGKPYADRKKGMLPPKLARIMVNLALKERVWMSAQNDELNLYDPFCGTGTVLIEAAYYGLELNASDLDVKSVLGTGENLDWMKVFFYREHFDFTYHTVTKDVSNVTLADFGGSKRINYIVTEPFLGRQTPNPAQLEGIFRGLEKLYWGAFRNWTELLEDGAEIVMVFPLVVTPKKVFNLDSLLDKVEKLGYNVTFKPLLYGRPGAIVQRQIIGFKFKGA